jgi:rubrerythrin
MKHGGCTVDIINALEILKKLELKVRDLYEYYHNIFKVDKEASACFFELSLEEKSHVDLIDYQLRTVKKNRKMFCDVEFDMQPLSQLIAEIESKASSKESVSLEDALKFAIRLESDALEFHYKRLIVKSNPAVEELMNRLGTSDKEHSDKLRNIAFKKGCLDLE